MRNEVSCTTFPSPSWSFCGSAVRLALRAQGGFVPDSWGLGEGSGLGLAADLAWCAQAPPVLRGGRYLGRARSSRQEGPEGPHCRGPEPVVSGRATGALGLGRRASAWEAVLTAPLLTVCAACLPGLGDRPAWILLSAHLAACSGHPLPLLGCGAWVACGAAASQ